MLVVTRATVVIHVPCDVVRPAVGFGFFGPLSSLVALLPRVEGDGPSLPPSVL